MMRNLCFKIAFNGANYHGFQVQKDKPTVCSAFQDAFCHLTGFRGEVKGCSRTDSGVHANCFYLSIKTESAIPLEGFIRAMNTLLPDDIAVLGCEEKPLDFHARYDCKGKRYVYKILNRPYKDPFLQKQAYFYPYPIDVPLLNKAAKFFLGRHDFKGFCASGSDVKDTVRTIYACNVVKKGDLVLISVTGDGFLYNMVRIIVGTLLEVAEKKIPAAELSAIIDSGKREKAGRTVPACGLYLDDVFYSEEALSSST